MRNLGDEPSGSETQAGDEGLAELARAVYDKFSFRMAAIGPEVFTLPMIEEAIRGMVKRRDCR
jgi:hypothetical protein